MVVVCVQETVGVTLRMSVSVMIKVWSERVEEVWTCYIEEQGAEKYVQIHSA